MIKLRRLVKFRCGKWNVLALDTDVQYIRLVKALIEMSDGIVFPYNCGRSALVFVHTYTGSEAEVEFRSR